MADQFDPYHKWLGISPEKQPPNLYQLLGVDEFESDPDVIESAADQRMAHVRTFQSGKQGKLSQKLLNEISAARVTLLNPDKKSAYDEELREKLDDAEDPLGPSIAQLGGTTLPSPGGMGSEPAASFSAPVVSAKRVKRKKPAWMLPAGISVAALVILGIVVVIIFGRAKKGDEEKTVADQKPFSQSNQSDQEDSNGGTKGKTITNTNAPNVPEDPDKEPTSRDEENGAKDATTTNGETAASTENVDNTAEETPQVEMPDTNETAANPFEPKPAETETPQKQPVPTSQQQVPVEETLAETFDLSKERTAEQQLELARELFELAGKSKDTVERFVLLRGTMRLAGEGGDAALVMKAVDEIDRHYKIDRLEIGKKALVGFGEQAASEEAMESLARTTNQFIDEAIAANRIGVAASLAEAVYELTLKKPVSTEVRKQAYDRRNQLNEMHDQWNKVQDALAELKEDPSDPEANLVVGKWHCFEQGDWKSGLPYLATSGHKLLSTLATREKDSPPESTDEIVALADAWWDAAEGTDGTTQRQIWTRAAHWYRQALPELSGLPKVKVKERLAAIPDTSAERENSLRAQADAVIPTGCVLLLTFDKETIARVGRQVIAKDSSGLDHHAQLYNAEITDGVIGEAVSLGGEDSHALIQKAPRLHGSENGITISIWFKLRSVDAEGRLLKGAVMVGRKASGYSLKVDGLRLVVGVGRWIDTPKNGWTKPELNKWTHVAALYSKQGGLLYINGKVTGRSGFEGQILPSPSNLFAGPALDGTIDELMIFDRPLSREQIEQIYAVGRSD